MKKHYALLLFWGALILSAQAQLKPYSGNWYAGLETGLMSGRTRMITGDLGKYAPGGSGILVPYDFKFGYNYNPYLSLESGIGTLPVNMVYVFETGRIIGSNPIRFTSIPLRINYRVYVLNQKLEAYTSVGLQYVHINSANTSKEFQGEIVTNRHVFADTLAYKGTIGVVRHNAFLAEIGVGFNWTVSKRWTLNVYGRQNIGLMNLASVRVSIQQNQETAEDAMFVSRGAGINIGIGLRYNFKH